MNRRIQTIGILMLLMFSSAMASPLDIQEIFKGEDSAILRGYLNVYNEYAPKDKNVRLLDIIMDTDGLSSARKAQNYIKQYGTDPASNWFLLLLADYYIASGNVVLAKGILDKAFRRNASIENDRYYQLIKGRIDGTLPDVSQISGNDYNSEMSVDLTRANKILEENNVLIDKSEMLPGLPEKTSTPSRQISSSLYHLQIGAFSRKANAEERRDYFLREGYPAAVRVRATENGTMFAVWIGDYQDRESALVAKEHLLKQYSTDSFIVKD
jgi:hypothetical protein